MKRDQSHHTQSSVIASGTAVELVRLDRGVPVTDSLTIAREFGRQHKNVLRALDALIADSTINRLNFEPVQYVDAKGEKRRKIELTERGALIAMPFIGGRNSRIGQVRLVDAFLALRDSISSARPSSERITARHEAASHYSVVSDMLALTRQAAGKTTEPHHFANEARLIGFALTTEYQTVDRERLSADELRILKKLEVRDASLIAAGESYGERKTALVAYASTLRAAKLSAASTGQVPGGIK